VQDRPTYSAIRRGTPIVPEDGHPSVDEVIADAKVAQRSTVFPDTLRGGRSVDAFLWRGDPNATTVQRVALIIFAITFLSMSIAFVDIFLKEGISSDKLIYLYISIGFILISVRLIWKAFRRPPKNGDDS
jgi:hypothetical protein